MLLKIQQASDINFYIYKGVWFLGLFPSPPPPKFWKPFSLNSTNNEKHLFVARSVWFYGRLAWNLLARGSAELMVKMGRWDRG